MLLFNIKYKHSEIQFISRNGSKVRITNRDKNADIIRNQVIITSPGAGKLLSRNKTSAYLSWNRYPGLLPGRHGYPTSEFLNNSLLRNIDT